MKNKKEKVQNKKEICGLCKKYILIGSDSYCHLIDYKEGKFFVEGFYHNPCYNEMLGKAKNLKKVQNVALNLFEKLGLTKENINDFYIKNMKGGMTKNV